MIKNNLLFTEGKYILVLSLLATAVGYFIHPIIALFGIVFIIFSLYFFRNPVRNCAQASTDDAVIVSPADGKVVDVSKGDYEGFTQKISIFLSPLDVHVNWMPMEGIIEAVTYRAGKFLLAFTPKSSELNERNDVLITSGNKKLLVRQIAGTVARRIVCWVQPGDYGTHKDKYGMIRFGSRVDIFMPAEVTLEVKKGDRVYGGQTVVGRWHESI